MGGRAGLPHFRRHAWPEGEWSTCLRQNEDSAARWRLCDGCGKNGGKVRDVKKFMIFLKKGVDFCPLFAYNNFRTKRNGELCNGSTYDSDSYCLGSNPSSPANGSMVKRLRRRPLKAKSGVRFPLELPAKTLIATAMSVFVVHSGYSCPLQCAPSSWEKVLSRNCGLFAKRINR